MKAKTINEALSDVLKPKTTDEITKAIPQDKMKFVEECYELVCSSGKYDIISDLGFMSGMFGFQFETKFPMTKEQSIYHTGEIGEFTLGFIAEENDVYIIFENAGSDYHLEDIEDLRKYLGMEHEGLVESTQDIFKPKSKEEIKDLIPGRRRIWNKMQSAMIYDPNRKSYPWPHYKVTCPHCKTEIVLAAVFGKKEWLCPSCNNPISKSITESISDVLKPKPEKEIRKHFEKTYPVFVKLFYHLFPDQEYQLDMGEGWADSRVFFTVTDKGKSGRFLLSQSHHHKFPQISYLDTSHADDKISGVFHHNRTVQTVKEVESYIKDHIS
ncbi:MAG: hypothetical protein GYA51_00405 [Candidatus Methanofastidiosa archaeon]|nr:hypothetical protein [Candidatus Methanofastidiosa archaeon]